MKKINWPIVIPWTVAAVALILLFVLQHVVFVVHTQKDVPWWSIFPWGPLATVTSALIAIKVAVKIYTEQKLWERRVEEYSKLIDALSLIIQEIEIDIDRIKYKEMYGVASPKLEELRNDLQERSLEARKYVHIIGLNDSFYLSDDAVAAMMKMMNTQMNSGPYDAEIDELSMKFTSFKTCIQELNKCAIKDLKLNIKRKLMSVDLINK